MKFQDTGSSAVKKGVAIPDFLPHYGDGFKCFACPRGTMDRKAKALFVLSLFLLSVLPYPVQAEESGGVQSSVAQMALTPQQPVLSLIHI